MNRRVYRGLLVAGTAAVLAVLAVVLGGRAAGGGAEPLTPRDEPPAAGAAADPGEAISRTPVGEGDAAPARTAADAEEALPRAFGAVQLRAVDDASGDAIFGFTWTAVGDVPGLVESGAASGDTAHLRVPLGLAAAVRVAAPGYAPSLAVDVALRDGATSRAAVARLARIGDGPSAVLTVRDGRGAPIPRILVACSTNPRSSRDRSGWQSQWTRESHAPDGVHAFAGLAEGRHRFRIVALEDTGRPRLLLPETCQLTLRDGETAAADVTLDGSAGSLILVVRDPESGAMLGPGLAIRLRDRGGRAVTTRWLAAAGEPVSSAGTLPVAGACEPVEPLPPGRYLLSVSGHGIDAEREIRIAAGQRTHCALP